MKKYFTTIFLYFLIVMPGHSQVGMPGNGPNKNAILDLNNTDGTNNKGLLLPKVMLNSTVNPAPMSSHSAGMFIYSTMYYGSGSYMVVPGPYFNTGTDWYSLFSSKDGWLTQGNSATNTTSNFLGTTNAVDLVTKTSGIERSRMTSSGQFLIGTSSVPTGGTNAKVIISSSNQGALQLKDGTEGPNYVLTSDANGAATWKEKELTLGFAAKSATGVNVPATPLNTWIYTTQTLTLPPGKWLVSVTMILNKGTTGSVTAVDEYWFLNSTFSDSSGTLAVSPDIQTNKSYISGALYPSCIYNLMKGSVIITNSTAANKTYYYMVKVTGRNMTGQIVKFGGNLAENLISYKEIQ